MLQELAQQTETEQSAEEAMALLGVKLDDVLRELEYRRQKRVANAVRIQRRAAKENGERRILRAGSEGGEFQMQIHPEFYHYWGQRLGYACWSDPQFVKEFLRDNPEVRIKSFSEKLTVGVDGFRAPAEQPARGRIVGRRGRWAA